MTNKVPHNSPPLEGAGGGGQRDVLFLSLVDPKDGIKQAKMTMASSRMG